MKFSVLQKELMKEDSFDRVVFDFHGRKDNHTALFRFLNSLEGRKEKASLTVVI